MNKEKSTFEKVVLMLISCLIDNCDVMFNVNELPPIKIYRNRNKKDFE